MSSITAYLLQAYAANAKPRIGR